MAADVTHLGLDTAAERHTTVASRTHHDYLVASTLGTERLRVAVVAAVHCRFGQPQRCQLHQHHSQIRTDDQSENSHSHKIHFVAAHPFWQLSQV